MKVAITGGTGFVGRHLAERLRSAGHEVVLVARGVAHSPAATAIERQPGVCLARAGVDDPSALRAAFDGCAAVVHAAGINREVGAQNFAAVHVQGTANVVAAAKAAGAAHVTLVSFLRARPSCGSPYHESKWAAEELVRGSSLAWTVVKPGVVYGPGDQFVGHLSRTLRSLPVYVGMGDRPARPVWVGDLVEVLAAACADRRLDGRTVPVVGPTALGVDDAVRVIARAVDRRIVVLRAPVVFHRLLARTGERVMPVPLVTRAQVRMLEEGLVAPARAPDDLPADLEPGTPFTVEQVRAAGGVPGGRRPGP